MRKRRGVLSGRAWSSPLIGVLSAVGAACGKRGRRTGGLRFFESEVRSR